LAAAGYWVQNQNLNDHRVITHMKLTFLASASAIIGFSAFALSLVQARHAAEIFSIAVIAMILLSAARDYAPRRPFRQFGQSSDRATADARISASEFMKLAA
jgi:hypothetical protein